MATCVVDRSTWSALFHLTSTWPCLTHRSLAEEAGAPEAGASLAPRSSAISASPRCVFHPPELTWIRILPAVQTLVGLKISAPDGRRAPASGPGGRRTGRRARGRRAARAGRSCGRTCRRKKAWPSSIRNGRSWARTSSTAGVPRALAGCASRPAEAGVEEARVVVAQLADAHVDRQHLGGEVGRDRAGARGWRRRRSGRARARSGRRARAPAPRSPRGACAPTARELDHASCGAPRASRTGSRPCEPDAQQRSPPSPSKASSRSSQARARRRSTAAWRGSAATQLLREQRRLHRAIRRTWQRRSPRRRRTENESGATLEPRAHRGSPPGPRRSAGSRRTSTREKTSARPVELRGLKRAPRGRRGGRAPPRAARGRSGRARARRLRPRARPAAERELRQALRRSARARAGSPRARAARAADAQVEAWSGWSCSGANGGAPAARLERRAEQRGELVVHEDARASGRSSAVYLPRIPVAPRGWPCPPGDISWRGDRLPWKDGSGRGGSSAVAAPRTPTDSRPSWSVSPGRSAGRPSRCACRARDLARPLDEVLRPEVHGRR